MPPGFVSLLKKTAVESLQPTDDPIEQLRISTHANLHIVETDRRAVSRSDISPYLMPKARSQGAYLFFKRPVDVLGAVMGILVLSPLILAIVLSILLSGSSPIFRHRRVGQFGEYFDCLKFRTMVKNADQVLQNLLDSDRQIKAEWLRDHKLKNDPRITNVGRFLRKTSLDELPQLWNVLTGDMSLVGPRPVVPDELRRYGTKIRTYLLTKPGLTGLWQVSGRNELTYRRRVALDVVYARSRSFVLDLYILAKTIPAVFAKSGAY